MACSVIQLQLVSVSSALADVIYEDPCVANRRHLGKPRRITQSVTPFANTLLLLENAGCGISKKM